MDRPIIAPEDGLDDRVMLMACAAMVQRCIKNRHLAKKTSLLQL
ncbi:hypothetical protein [Ochrobactrum quorumnocens]|nr:hypothetical protein [[Ochrobactrum] quorumnocens]